MGDHRAIQRECIQQTKHRLHLLVQGLRVIEKWAWEPTSFGVALEAQHDLRSTVPSRRDVFCHVSCILFRVNRESSGQSKITNLQLAIGVHQQVTRLQITVKNIGRMDVFQSTEDLVDETLKMRIGEGLSGSDDGREIAFHKFYTKSVFSFRRIFEEFTFVEICLIEIIGPWNIHIIEASNLILSARHLPSAGVSRTLRCPLKCCSSFISRRARFAKIFLLKTLVTFLIATPSWVWEFVAAL